MGGPHMRSVLEIIVRRLVLAGIVQEAQNIGRRLGHAINREGEIAIAFVPMVQMRRGHGFRRFVVDEVRIDLRSRRRAEICRLEERLAGR